MFNITDTAKKIIAAGHKKNMAQTVPADEIAVSYQSMGSQKRKSLLFDTEKIPSPALFFYSTMLISDSYALYSIR